MKNGTRKTMSAKMPAKKTAGRLKLPPKPVFVEPRRRKNGLLSKDDAAAYNEYIQQLRDWLWALPDARFDREIRKLSLRDVHSVNWLNTYENYQNGGPMREIVESTF